MMADDNKFFRFIWRLDAILLAIAGALAITLLGVGFVTNFLRPKYEPIPEGNFRPVPRAAEQNYTYRLESQYDTASLPHERILVLRRWKGSPESYGFALEKPPASLSYSSYSTYTDAANLLAINTDDGTSRWLFEGYGRTILTQEVIFNGPPPSIGRATSAEPIASVIRSVDSDTNKDGELDGKDTQSLYAYRPGDTRAVKFFTADYILSAGETDAENYLVVYEKGPSAFAATFHIPDFKLKSVQKIPGVP
jgi:hypothetical protein